MRIGCWDRLRLRTKIILLLVGTAALPLAIAEVLTVHRARSVVAERTEALLDVRTEQLVNELDALNGFYLAAARHASSLTSALPALTAADPQVLAHVREHLEGWPRTDKTILSVSLVDPNGRVIASSDRMHEGLDISFRPYFRSALGGRAVISDPFLPLPVTHAGPTVAYAAPVLAPGGRPAGVTVLLVHAEALWRAVRAGNERAGAGSYSVLLDSTGIRLAHSLADDFVFRPAGQLDRRVIDALVREQRFGSRTRALLEAPIVAPELMERATARDAPDHAPFEGISPTNREHNHIVARRLTTVDWTLFYVVPVSTMNASARAIASSFVPAGLAGIAAISGCLLIGLGAVRRLAELTRGVDAVARGERASVRARGEDEIAHLAHRFNEMASAVQHARLGLERRVRERTQELSDANRELEAQKRELVVQREQLEQQRAVLQAKNEEVERADRLKSEFLANMSHELRTPLNSIIGFSELLAEQAGERLTATEARYLHDVRASGKHLLQLINDILELSKIEAGHATIEPSDVEPAVAVGEATELVLPAAREKGIDVRARAEAAPLVRGDPRRIRQVLLNLLSNAIKFAPAGSAIEVSAVAGADHVRFSVRDHGPGVDDALRQRLFRPFVQGESPLVKTHQGTGLGLAISRRLVEMQGGTIDVEPAPGGGATFHFTVPLASRGSGPELPGGAVAFVVEENAAAARALADWLQDEGYRPVTVAPGVDAWELAARTRPTAIVLDPASEHRDGFELLEELKRRKQTGALPLLPSSRAHPELAGAQPSRVSRAPAPGEAGVVLSIDDDPQVATVLRAVLEPAGYAVRAVTRGDAGIQAARAERPSLALVDLVLPDMPGFAVVDALARDDRTRNVPVVVLTAAELGPADRARLEATVRAVVGKGTVTRDELVRAIRRATARTSAPSANPRVVVIDDDDVNRELVRAVLERRGWRALLASDGERGIALVRAERPSLVLCDVAMPGVDGLAVARTLKSDPQTAAIPLVAVTALAMAGDEQRAYAAGFDAYVAKPLEPKALERALGVLVDGGDPPRQDG